MIGDRRGFTLVEALVALTISTIVILLVASLFLVQSDYYAWMRDRARIQDAARSVVERVADEVRSMPPGAALLADSTRFAFRQPLAFGVVCGFVGSEHAVHLRGGTAEFETAAVDGVAVRADDGSWSFADASWGTIDASGAGATACASEGADTSGAASDFVRMSDLGSMTGVATDVGSVVLLYAELELRFQASTLDPQSSALYRGPYGGSLVEFATGMAPGAHFAYRTGGSSYSTSATGTDLAQIDGLRVHGAAIGNPTASERGRAEIELVGDVLLRNVN